MNDGWREGAGRDVTIETWQHCGIIYYTVLPSFYLYGRDELDDRPKQVRKWIICSGAIESAALAHCHDERGSEGLTRKTLGQSVG